MITNYKELNFYKKAHEFTCEIYKVTKNYPKEEVYGLTSQVKRASSSICANTAEGSGKSSQADFKRFLSMSLGSAKECEYWLLLSKDLDYISVDTYDRLSSNLNFVIGSLVNYMKKIN